MKQESIRDQLFYLYCEFWYFFGQLNVSSRWDSILLEIYDCHHPRVVGDPQHLTTLELLEIYDCQEIDLLDTDDGMHFQGLRNLTCLVITRIPKLVSLPARFQHVTTLQSLQIYSCENLMTLPEWISNLASLQRTFIYYCCKLTSLPEGMCPLTALQHLEVLCSPLT